MVYQLLALIILEGFYACYFGKMLSQRRRGIRTDQMSRGKTGRVRAIEIAVKCVTVHEGQLARRRFRAGKDGAGHRRHLPHQPESRVSGG